MHPLIRLFKQSRLPYLLYRVHNAALRVRKPLTLGVRALVVDADGAVLLVRHSYRPGWYFPGGGVRKWETLEQAAIREAREETGVEIEALDGLFGVYANFTPLRSDHVALYVARRWRPGPFESAPFESAEIAEARFFPAAALPEDATGPTRRRIAEFLGLRDREPYW